MSRAPKICRYLDLEFVLKPFLVEGSGWGLKDPPETTRLRASFFLGCSLSGAPAVRPKNGLMNGLFMSILNVHVWHFLPGV